MKRIISLAIICLSLVQLIAQNLPQGIAYQAVAVKDGPYSLAGQNPQAIYWSNKDIKVRFTIFEKYPGGSAQYSEFHATKTDDYGVFNLIIGQGTTISGDFTKIPWDLGTAHLQVEIDFDNNGTYKLTSLERFWSVPYAFVTRKSSSTSTDSALNALNNKFNYLRNRDKDTVIGNEGGVSYKSLDSLNKVLVAKLAAIQTSDKDTIVGNEWQKLTRVGDTLTLSDGGGKVTLLDEDPTNELQQLTINGDSIFISKGNFVVLKTPKLNTSLQSASATILKESIKVSGKYKSSSPYGWIFESITRIDSVQLKKGDRFVLYTPELGGSLGSSWFVTDSTNSILKGIALGHATSSSGSSPSGLSNFSINSGGGGSSPGYMYEIRIPIPHDGKYYIRVNSSQYWPVGTTNATWDIGALYYEIN
jgi:hypothetical protein